jgi:hypothetical protein
MLEAQAAMNGSLAQQQGVIDRGRKLAQENLAFEKDRGEQLRGGTYYKPGGTPTAVSKGIPVVASGGETETGNLNKMPDRVRNMAKAALRTKDAGAVRKKLIDEGYDPEDIGK